MRTAIIAAAITLLLCSVSAAGPQTTIALDEGQLSSELCTACKVSVHIIEDLLCDSLAEHALIRLAQQHICRELGNNPLCLDLADKFVPLAIQWFRARGTVGELCRAPGVCGNGILADPVFNTGHQVRSDNMACATCQYVIREAQLDLTLNSTQAMIMRLTHKACHVLPPELAKPCIDLAQQYEILLVQWIESADPEHLCAWSGLCMEKLVAMIRPAPLTPKALSFVSAFADVHAPASQACQVCLLAVAEAASILADRHVQAELQNFTKNSVCHSLGKYEEMCNNYVDVYFPFIITILQSYLTPELCTEIHACKSSPSMAGALQIRGATQPGMIAAR